MYHAQGHPKSKHIKIYSWFIIKITFIFDKHPDLKS